MHFKYKQCWLRVLLTMTLYEVVHQSMTTTNSCQIGELRNVKPGNTLIETVLTGESLYKQCWLGVLLTMTLSEVAHQSMTTTNLC